MEPRKDATTAGLERELTLIEEEENPLSIESKIEYLNGLAVEKIKPEYFISEKEEKQILNDHNALEFAKQQMELSGKLMKENTDCFSLYEFHKGQFLAYRKVVDKHYR